MGFSTRSRQKLFSSHPNVQWWPGIAAQMPLDPIRELPQPEIRHQPLIAPTVTTSTRVKVVLHFAGCRKLMLPCSLPGLPKHSAVPHTLFTVSLWQGLVASLFFFFICLGFVARLVGFGDTVSLCSSCLPGPHRGPPAFARQVLRLKVCTTVCSTEAACSSWPPT